MKDLNLSEPFLQYDPDTFPFDEQIAKDHGKAQSIGKREANQSGMHKTCPCCAQQIEVEPIGICESREELNILGSAYPLFFEYSLWSIFFMFLGSIIFTPYGMISNMNGNNCIQTMEHTFKELAQSCPNPTLDPCLSPQSQEQEDEVLDICQFYENGINSVIPQCCSEFCTYVFNGCLETGINQFYFPNKQFESKDRFVQSLLIFILCFASIATMQWMRYRIRLSEEELDRGAVTASDYTIMLRNLPQYEPNELKTAIEAWWQRQDLEIPRCTITKIIIAYDILKYSDLCKKKVKLMKKYKTYVKYYQKHNKYPVSEQQVNQLKGRIEDCKNKIDKIESEDIKTNKLKTSEIAFVSFKTQKEMRLIVDYTKSSFYSRLFNRMKLCWGKDIASITYKGKLIQVDRAPEPSDVFWENCGFTSKQKFYQRMKSSMLTSLLLFFIFVIFVGIQYAQAKITTHIASIQNAVYYIEALSLGFSFLVQIVNIILVTIISELTNIERQSTQTGFNISIAVKLCSAQFINTIVLTYISNILVTQVSGVNFRQRLQDAIQKKSGIADDMIYIMLTNSFVTPIMSLFNPFYFLNLYKRYSIAKHKEENLLTQSEANAIYEGPQIYLYSKYTYILVSLFIAGFYGSLIPLAFPMTFIGLTLQYWVEKFQFSYVYARPVSLSEELNNEMIEYLEFFAFYLALGQFLLDFIFHQDISPYILFINIASLLVTSVNFVFPAKLVQQKLFPIEEIEDETPYEKAQLEFINDYDRTNPVTKEHAINEWLNFIQGQDEEMYKSQKNSLRNCININKYMVIESIELNRVYNFNQLNQQSHIQEADSLGNEIKRTESITNNQEDNPLVQQYQYQQQYPPQYPPQQYPQQYYQQFPQ